MTDANLRIVGILQKAGRAAILVAVKSPVATNSKTMFQMYCESMSMFVDVETEVLSYAQYYLSARPRTVSIPWDFGYNAQKMFLSRNIRITLQSHTNAHSHSSSSYRHVSFLVCARSMSGCETKANEHQRRKVYLKRMFCLSGIWVVDHPGNVQYSWQETMLFAWFAFWQILSIDSFIIYSQLYPQLKAWAILLMTRSLAKTILSTAMLFQNISHKLLMTICLSFAQIKGKQITECVLSE